MRILLVCDRSAGHVFPALAVAKKIIQHSPRDKVYFFATSNFLKEYLVKEGFVVYGKSFLSRNLAVEMLYRIFEAVYLIVVIRPNKLIGFGGRDSFFLMLFGSLFFLKTSIYEPNVKCGKANRLLSLFAGKILCGVAYAKKSDKYVTIGIPLRPNIKKIDKSEALRTIGLANSPTIFCFGGSQGSVFLNTVFSRLVNELTGNFQAIHLTGTREYFKLLQFYNTIKRKSFVRDFYYQMEILYSAADIVISRAGASTLGEISYYGLPAILIPHPDAGGHQKENALYFSYRKAAYMFLHEGFNFEEFKRTAQNLLNDFDLRQKIKNNLSDIKTGISFEDFCKNNYF